MGIKRGYHGDHFSSLIYEVLITATTILMMSPTFIKANEYEVFTINNQKDCDMLASSDKNLITNGQIIVYSGAKVENCNFGYNVKAEQICFDPLKWNVTSCAMEITFYQNNSSLRNIDNEVWRCSSTPRLRCVNDTTIYMNLKTEAETDDNFRILVYGNEKKDSTNQKPADKNKKNKDEDEKKDKVIQFGAGFFIGIVLGFLLCIVISGLAIIKYRNKILCHSCKSKKANHVSGKP